MVMDYNLPAMRHTDRDPDHDVTCAGRPRASMTFEDSLRRQILAGNPGTFTDVSFCSTSAIGTRRTSYWVHFTRNGIPSGLVTVEFAEEMGIVTPEAVLRFMGGPRRTAEELASQREQLRKDTELAAKQADDIQGIHNFWKDLRDSAKDLVQTTGPLVVALAVGYVVILALKVMDD